MSGGAGYLEIIETHRELVGQRIFYVGVIESTRSFSRVWVSKSECGAV